MVPTETDGVFTHSLCTELPFAGAAGAHEAGGRRNRTRDAAHPLKVGRDVLHVFVDGAMPGT